MEWPDKYDVFDSIDKDAMHYKFIEDKAEITVWLKANAVPSLPFAKSYAASIDSGYVDGQAEYVLSEKLSAVFLLKFL